MLLIASLLTSIRQRISGCFATDGSAYVTGVKRAIEPNYGIPILINEAEATLVESGER